MKRFLPLSLLLIATASFADPVTLDTETMDARLAASLEAQVEAKIYSLNSIGMGEVTVIGRIPVDAAALRQEPVQDWSVDKIADNERPFL